MMTRKTNRSLVLMTDFGLSESFVASMKGVAISVYPDIRLFDLTHNIEPFNVLEGAYALAETIIYWPEETVFVAVVDPGVGTERRSIVCRTNSGHYIMCPDNGLLSIVRKEIGLKEIRIINTDLHRLQGSESFHTFHGRDIYAYNGSRLAAGLIELKELGDKSTNELVELESNTPSITGNILSGTVIKIERPFGNLTTDIPGSMLREADISEGVNLEITLIKAGNEIELRIPFNRSFGYVEEGEALCYLDSSGRLGLAVNQHSFVERVNIKKAFSWKIKVKVHMD
ncbi:S-adenosyl-l-methionine hydroxide adenosyltransferase family protein [Bacteroidota bacterium]